MLAKRLWIGVAVVGLVVGSGSVAHAKCVNALGQGCGGSLRSQLEGAFGDITLANPTHDAHFSSAALAELGPLIGSLAGTAGDFPAVSTTPGFVYHYNPDLKVFERSARNLGPVFVERAETVGKNRLDIGVEYFDVSFHDLNGKPLDSQSFTLAHENVPPPGYPSPPFEGDTISVDFTKFTLRSDVVSLFGTYGITDRWDVNLLLPIVVTSLDARATAKIHFSGGSSSDHSFGGGRTETSLIVDDGKTGVGDLLLRTKYRFTESEGFNAAGGLTVRFPTGNSDNFQGLGDYTVAPYLIMSRLVTIPALEALQGPHDVHLNVGIEANASDVSRSRARYGAGVTWRLLERLALVTDVIGSSGLTQSEVAQVPVDPPNTGTKTVDARTDLVDFNIGLKVNPFGSMIAFVGAIVPLNNDGLRTQLIPTGGIEYDF